MAYYCSKRKSYVCKSTNKRFKGLAKDLKKRHFPDYKPPK